MFMDNCKEVIFSGHAIRRMFEREISRSAVHSVLSSGETIAEYPDDIPFPSILMLGFINGKPLHVVVAINHENICYVVTSYIPALDKWSDGFTIRR